MGIIVFFISIRILKISSQTYKLLDDLIKNKVSLATSISEHSV